MHGIRITDRRVADVARVTTSEGEPVADGTRPSPGDIHVNTTNGALYVRTPESWFRVRLSAFSVQEVSNTDAVIRKDVDRVCVTRCEQRRITLTLPPISSYADCGFKHELVVVDESGRCAVKREIRIQAAEGDHIRRPVYTRTSIRKPYNTLKLYCRADNNRWMIE